MNCRPLGPFILLPPLLGCSDLLKSDGHYQAECSSTECSVKGDFLAYKLRREKDALIPEPQFFLATKENLRGNTDYSNPSQFQIVPDFCEPRGQSDRTCHFLFGSGPNIMYWDKQLDKAERITVGEAITLQKAAKTLNVCVTYSETEDTVASTCREVQAKPFLDTLSLVQRKLAKTPSEKSNAQTQ